LIYVQKEVRIYEYGAGGVSRLSSRPTPKAGMNRVLEARARER
jgi:hypothetical protein